MNFTSSSHHRNPVLRGSAFTTSLLIKPEILSLNNHNNNHNHLNNNCTKNGATSFLTISKSRVPDIQMINKYYGLVPKKFVINARSDYSSNSKSTKLRARTATTKAHSFDEESYSNGSPSTTFTTERIILPSKSKAKEKEKKCHDESLVNFPPSRSSSRRSSVSSFGVGEEDERVMSISINSEGEKELVVARKMSVEKQQRKWRKGNSNRIIGRSLSMMEDEDHLLMMGNLANSKGGDSQNQSHSIRNSSDLKSDIQRVIKIDLNNMRWEESYQSKTKPQVITNDSKKSPPPNSNVNPLQLNNNSPQHSKKLSSSTVQNNSNTNKNSTNTNGNGTGNSNSAVRRGTLRKTISFDEQLVRNTTENNNGNGINSNTSNKSENKDSEAVITKTRRPMTASVRTSASTTITASGYFPTLSTLSQVPSPSSTSSISIPSPLPSSSSSSASASSLSSSAQGKVQPWTSRLGQNASDRRAKFQKSFSIYNDSMDGGGGGGESDNEVEFSSTATTQSQSTSSSNLSSQSKFRESRKSLHVQPPPEISTMMSLMRPPEVEQDLQSEIDKVAKILNQVQDKISMVEEILVDEEEEEKQQKNRQNETQENAKNLQKINEDDKEFCTENKSDFPLEKLNTENTENQNGHTNNHKKDENINAITIDAGNVESCVAPVRNCNRMRKPLQKAASISCEAEFTSEDSNEKIMTKHARPQTSRAKSNTVSFCSTTSTRLIPPRSLSTSPPVTKESTAGSVGSSSSPPVDNSQSQASKNRKILIKKALIEINQSSINLGKKFHQSRPKTAPIPDKKNSITSKNNGNQQKRQPLKARSPPNIKAPSIARQNSTVNSKSVASNDSNETTGSSPANQPIEPEVGNPTTPKPKRAISRQNTFSETLLGGFLSSEISTTTTPKTTSTTTMVEGLDGSVSDSEVITSFINSKKREECLKIYEKMMKKGCAVKLETIFRGMMTPSEYRLFLEATEMAEKISNSNSIDDETSNGRDAGVSPLNDIPGDINSTTTMMIEN